MLGVKQTLLRCPAGLHTRLVDTLAVPGWGDEVTRGFMGALTEVAHDWYELEFDLVLASSPSITRTQESSLNLVAIERARGGGYYLPTTGNYARERETVAFESRRRSERVRAQPH